MNTGDSYSMGSGVVTAFLWNTFITPLGFEPMDAVAAPAVGFVLWRTIQWAGSYLPQPNQQGEVN